MEFKGDPIPSGVDETVLKKAGLVYLGEERREGGREGGRDGRVGYGGGTKSRWRSEGRGREGGREGERMERNVFFVFHACTHAIKINAC
jgi:hypothetical protein